MELGSRRGGLRLSARLYSAERPRCGPALHRYCCKGSLSFADLLPDGALRIEARDKRPLRLEAPCGLVRLGQKRHAAEERAKELARRKHEGRASPGPGSDGGAPPAPASPKRERKPPHSLVHRGHDLNRTSATYVLMTSATCTHDGGHSSQVHYKGVRIDMLRAPNSRMNLPRRGRG